MHKFVSKKYIYYLCNILLLLLQVNAEQLNPKKYPLFKQNLSQIIWEKVKDNEQNKQKPLIWKIDENPRNINFENYMQEVENINKNTLISSSFFLNKGEKIFDYGLINDKSYYFKLNIGLSKAFNLNFSSETINSEISSNHKNKIKNIFLNNNSRNIRLGGKIKISSQSRGDLISTNLRLSYGEIFNDSRHGYLYSEIMNKYSKNDSLSFNINPKISFTNFGNIYSITANINWRLNPKFEISPEANISLNNAEDNYSLIGRTFLSSNIIIESFISNSSGMIDMAKQFKSKSVKYGAILRLRF